jgi:hypothetical protein
MKYHRVYSHPVDKSAGIMADQSIALDGFYTGQDYPEHLRRIRFCDPDTNKRLVFLTNNFALPVSGERLSARTIETREAICKRSFAAAPSSVSDLFSRKVRWNADGAKSGPKTAPADRIAS